MPTCSKCENDKPPEDFDRNLLKKNGLQSWCRKCTRDAAYKRYVTKKAALGVDVEPREPKPATRYTNKKLRAERRSDQRRILERAMATPAQWTPYAREPRTVFAVERLAVRGLVELRGLAFRWIDPQSLPDAWDRDWRQTELAKMLVYPLVDSLD